MSKKKLVVAGSVTGALIAGWLGATWWSGLEAEKTLAKQHKMIADLPYFTVKNHAYTRGFFSSRESTTITLNDSMLRPALEMAKLAGHEIPKLELTYTQTVKHGPFPLISSGSFALLKADVTTDVQFSEDTRKFLGKVFGDQKPLQLENRVHFGDSGEFLITIPKFTYEETLAKVKADWQGLEARIAYDGDFNKVDVDAQAPGLHFEANGQVSLDLKGFKFVAHNARGASGVMLGKGDLTLERANFKRVEEGKEPIEASLDQFAYMVKSEPEGEFVNSSGDFSLKQFALNGKIYGPARLAVSAKHIHGPTLAKLSSEISRIQREVPIEQQPAKIIELARKEGQPLFKNNLTLAIDELSVKLPEGDMNLKAKLSTQGYQDGDFDAPRKLLSHLRANAEMKMPRRVIEIISLWKFRGMIAAPEEATKEDQEDLDNLAKGLVDQYIKQLTAQQLIEVDGDILKTRADWNGEKLEINGKDFPLPWLGPQEPAQTH